MKNKLKVLLPLLFVIALFIALPLTANAEETTVTTDGVNITVSGLSEVRDFLIAPGHHEVYSAIKQSYILRVTGDKFDVSDRYTVAMTSVGEYTTSYDSRTKPRSSKCLSGALLF